MSNRIQREVEELLESLDKTAPKPSVGSRAGNAIKAPFRAVNRGLRQIHLPSVNPGHVLLAGIVIIVVAWVIGGADNGWRWVLAAGIFLFIGAFVWSLRRQSRPPEKYWRDKPLDLHERGPFWKRNKRR
jgi:hypothetical protein